MRDCERDGTPERGNASVEAQSGVKATTAAPPVAYEGGQAAFWRGCCAVTARAYLAAVGEG